MIHGPTYAGMRDPSLIAVRQRALKALKESPLDPVNLYNIT